MNARRWKELLAIAMIGEGSLATLFPQEHLGLWHTGPKILNHFLGDLERRPNLVRMLALLEAGFGFWLACRQFDQRSAEMKWVSRLGERVGTAAAEGWHNSRMVPSNFR